MTMRTHTANLTEMDAQNSQQRELSFKNYHEGDRLAQFSNKNVPMHFKNILSKKIRVRHIANVVLIYAVFILLLCLYYYVIGYPEIKIGFYCKDPSLSHTSKENTITTAQSMIYNFIVIPCLTISIAQCFIKSSWKDRTLNSAYLLAVVETGALVAFVITRFIKTLYSEYRPTFFDVCRPDSNENCTEGVYVKSFVCLNGDNMTQSVEFEISKSFPSTHTALASFVSIFCAYILVTGIPSRRYGIILKHILCFILTLWGIVNAFTRISDGEHHWWDVLSGAVVGIVVAFYTLYVC